MSGVGKVTRITDAQSTVRVAVSKALASGLILGIDNCEQEGIPLTQNQQVALATMHIMAYDQAIEAGELMEVDLHNVKVHRNDALS